MVIKIMFLSAENCACQQYLSNAEHGPHYQRTDSQKSYKYTYLTFCYSLWPIPLQYRWANISICTPAIRVISPLSLHITSSSMINRIFLHTWYIYMLYRFPFLRGKAQRQLSQIIPEIAGISPSTHIVSGEYGNLGSCRHDLIEFYIRLVCLGLLA